MLYLKNSAEGTCGTLCTSAPFTAASDASSFFFWLGFLSSAGARQEGGGHAPEIAGAGPRPEPRLRPSNTATPPPPASVARTHRRASCLESMRFRELLPAGLRSFGCARIGQGGGKGERAAVEQ